MTQPKRWPNGGHAVQVERGQARVVWPERVVRNADAAVKPRAQLPGRGPRGRSAGPTAGTTRVSNTGERARSARGTSCRSCTRQSRPGLDGQDADRWPKRGPNGEDEAQAERGRLWTRPRTTSARSGPGAVTTPGTGTRRLRRGSVVGRERGGRSAGAKAGTRRRSDAGDRGRRPARRSCAVRTGRGHDGRYADRVAGAQGRWWTRGAGRTGAAVAGGTAQRARADQPGRGRNGLDQPRHERVVRNAPAAVEARARSGRARA
jgi:hypothetical protein